MSQDYKPAEIEPKWQRFWADSGIFEVDRDDSRPPLFCLNMFPYPSGVLHVGHGRNYILGDAVVRWKMMRGFNVLAPMGWDAFGLPAENAAIKFGIHPAKWVADNVANMKRQFRSQGICFDWRREVNTSDPSYYRWTQWVFLKLFEAGLAYKDLAPVNWCTSCKCALANEEVKEGSCDRCGSEVVQRKLSQWYFRITKYAQRLLEDIDKLNGWPDRIRSMQQNWIGRSEGTEVDFLLDDGKTVIPCYTTRPDTLFGVTFFSLAVEHPIIPSLVAGTEYEKTVLEFVEANRRVGGIRGSEDAEKVGVFTGRYIINPVNGEKVPLWVANYALMEYGTGGVMAVPAHDQRDFLFAKKYGMPIKVVISPEDRTLDPATMAEAWEEPGVQVNSGSFDGMKSLDGKAAITDSLVAAGNGRRSVKYRLRDWLVSRQRYWGAPIPVVECPSCGLVGVPESQLPVKLPPVTDFRPSGERSPLAAIPEFVNTTCPKCGGPATRETDTIAQWLCSCWYFLRFTSLSPEGMAYDPEDEKYWMPVDQYIGGAEHAVLHLLYSRFITKALFDLDLVSVDEPFASLFTQGTIIKDGAKMSKSLGNVVSPDDIIEKFGADTLRLYTLFIAPPEKPAEWTDESVQGCHKFLRRVWELFDQYAPGVREIHSYKGGSELKPEEEELRRILHKTIRKVVKDIEEEFHFNTGIAAMMEMLNSARDLWPRCRPSVVKESLSCFARLLAPLAPHVAEECWQQIGMRSSVFRASIPVCDEDAARDPLIEVAVQISGKLRGRILVAPGTPVEVLKEVAMSNPVIAEQIKGHTVRKVIAIPDRIVNIVI